MKSLIVIFLAIFMIGLLFFDSAVREKTSALVVEKKPTWVNPVFKPALKYFFAEAKKRKIDISKFAKIDSIKYGLYPEAKDTIVGICQKKLLGKRIIGIKPGIRDPKKIRIILFHELGHCIFDLGHVPSKTLSIMNPKLKLDHIEIYDWFWPELINQYFTLSQEKKVPGEISLPDFRSKSDCCR